METDALVLLMLNELHSHLPEAERPMSMSDLSDEQAARARKAVEVLFTHRVPADSLKRLRDELEGVDRMQGRGVMVLADDLRALLATST